MYSKMYINVYVICIDYYNMYYIFYKLIHFFITIFVNKIYFINKIQKSL